MQSPSELLKKIFNDRKMHFIFLQSWNKVNIPTVSYYQEKTLLVTLQGACKSWFCLRVKRAEDIRVL